MLFNSTYSIIFAMFPEGQEHLVTLTKIPGPKTDLLKQRLPRACLVIRTPTKQPRTILILIEVAKTIGRDK